MVSKSFLSGESIMLGSKQFTQRARFCTAADKRMDRCQNKQGSQLLVGRLHHCSQQVDLNYTFLPLPCAFQHLCVGEVCILSAFRLGHVTCLGQWNVSGDDIQRICSGAQRGATPLAQDLEREFRWNKATAKPRLKWKMTEKFLFMV